MNHGWRSISLLHRQTFHPRRRAIIFSQFTVGMRRFSRQGIENVNTEHSRFIAEASPQEKWKDRPPRSKGIDADAGEDIGDIEEGKGKLSPTSSHLFKLILPLSSIRSPSNNPSKKDGPPTVFLLHPSQPLSHAARLILASISPATPEIKFRSVPSTHSPHGYEWSDSTDVGDFIRDAARAAAFRICISNPHQQNRNEDPSNNSESTIEVSVPTFADRTRYLRRRLDLLNTRIRSMEQLKLACDQDAHRGARRMALSGFGMLVVYWGAVARLTFWDYGWDVMEPVTYLSGLSTVICGYLWFLYQGREVSYSSVLDRSISARREALYKAKGFDVERWVDLRSEARNVRAEIARIAEDYEEEEFTEKKEEEKEAEKKSIKDETVSKDS